MNLQEIEKRMAEIKKEIDEKGDIEVLEKEVDDLSEQRKQLKEQAEKRRNILDKVAKEEKGEVIEEKKEERKDKKMTEEKNILETAEYRSAFLKKLMGKKLNEIEKRALTTDNESVGSTIPTQTLNKIDEKLRQTSALYPLVEVLNIPGYLSIPIEETTNDASWVAEGVASVDSADTTSSVSFAAHKLIKTVSITAEVSAMSIDAFESYVVKKLGEKMSVAIENAILNGAGNGQPTGILQGLFDATNSAEYTEGSMAYTDITGLIALLKAGYKPNSKFVINSKTLWNEIAQIVDDNKRPIFIPNVENGFAGRILGIPTIENEYIAEGYVLLGDFSKYTINFNKNINITTDNSVDFREGNTVYRALALLDGKVVNSEAFVLLETSDLSN